MSRKKSVHLKLQADIPILFLCVYINIKNMNLSLYRHYNNTMSN